MHVVSVLGGISDPEEHAFFDAHPSRDFRGAFFLSFAEAQPYPERNSHYADFCVAFEGMLGPAITPLVSKSNERIGLLLLFGWLPHFVAAAYESAWQPGVGPLGLSAAGTVRENRPRVFTCLTRSNNHLTIPTPAHAYSITIVTPTGPDVTRRSQTFTHS